MQAKICCMLILFIYICYVIFKINKILNDNSNSNTNLETFSENLKSPTEGWTDCSTCAVQPNVEKFNASLQSDLNICENKSIHNKFLYHNKSNNDSPNKCKINNTSEPVLSQLWLKNQNSNNIKSLVTLKNIHSPHRTSSEYNISKNKYNKWVYLGSNYFEFGKYASPYIVGIPLKEIGITADSSQKNMRFNKLPTKSSESKELYENILQKKFKPPFSFFIDRESKTKLNRKTQKEQRKHKMKEKQKIFGSIVPSNFSF